MTSPLPVEITTTDGCTLRGQLWPGDSDWVVLVHDVGSDDDLDVWQPLIPSLGKLGVSVCAVDQRGHGASDGEWSDERVNGDLGTMVRFARANGADSVAVIAAGSAAWTALEVAEVERVDGVVLLSADGWASYPSNSSPNERGTEEHRSLGRVSPSPNVGEGAHAAKSQIRSFPLTVPRAAGTPKLLIVGAGDTTAREITTQLQRASIGWSLIVTLPTSEHGTGLLAGEWVTQIREHVMAFLRERRYLARSGATREGGPQ